MPVEDVREKPPGVLFGISLRYVHRHVVDQPMDEGGDLFLPVGQVLVGVIRLRRRPVDHRARFDQFGTQRLQPIAQLPRRAAIVAVVVLDDGSVLILDSFDVVQLKG